MTHWAKRVAAAFGDKPPEDETVLQAMIREARVHAGMPARPPWRPIKELIAEAQARSDAEERAIKERGRDVD